MDRLPWDDCGTGWNQMRATASYSTHPDSSSHPGSASRPHRICVNTVRLSLPTSTVAHHRNDGSSPCGCHQVTSQNVSPAAVADRHATVSPSCGDTSTATDPHRCATARTGPPTTGAPAPVPQDASRSDHQPDRGAPRRPCATRSPCPPYGSARDARRRRIELRQIRLSTSGDRGLDPLLHRDVEAESVATAALPGSHGSLGPVGVGRLDAGERRDEVARRTSSQAGAGTALSASSRTWLRR
jgi:hypothetical protein